VDEAEVVLADAVDAYRVALGGRLVAAYALGSLAHGGFSALVSDVDLGLILADPLQPDDDTLIHAIGESQKSVGAVLAERLSVFWGTPATMRGESDGGRFPPLDRLDLIENGRLLAGADMRSALSRPTANEMLVAGAEFALDFLAGVRGDQAMGAGGLGSMQPATREAIEEIRDPNLLLARGIRRVTKLVLFPVRFMFTAATAHIGTNDDAVGWYLAVGNSPARSLVQAARTWRTEPPDDRVAAAQLLHDELVPLYLHYIDDHIDRLTAAGQPELVGGFELWRDRLRAEP
jgi:predicted nucleotidyltransferase